MGKGEFLWAVLSLAPGRLPDTAAQMALGWFDLIVHMDSLTSFPGITATWENTLLYLS